MATYVQELCADLLHSRHHPHFLRRVFCLQWWSYGRRIGSVWTTLEGICKVRLEIPDLGSVHLVHGDCHSSKYQKPSMRTSTANVCLPQVCWGPLSYVTAYMITVRHPYRFPIQAIVSLGQIYGLILYYATSLFDLYHKNISYCRPGAYYFWFYFFFVNFIWMVIPGCKCSSST